MAHGHTMLAQVLKWISRPQLELLESVHGTGRLSRVRSRWSQCGALVFAQLAGFHSLRDVVSSFASQANALAPLHLMPTTCSPMAAASGSDQPLFFTPYPSCQVVAPGHPFRRANGGIELHTLLDHAGHIPASVVLTKGKR